MSSVAVQVMPSAVNGFSKDSMIDNKLASDLDAKLISSSKQVLLQRIEFKPASKADEQYEKLKKKYVPLNSERLNSTRYTNGHGKESSKNENDDLPFPRVVLFPMDKVQLNWKQVRRIGPGLSNLGNTCFLNSVLQVLTYTAPLANYLASQEHASKCRTVGFCMLCELQRHVLRTHSYQQADAIKPMAIIQKLKFIAKHLRFGHQEDAHELLRYVIDGMQKSCLATHGCTEKLDRISKQTTMVHQVFGGYYRSQVRCLKCKNNSNTFDPLMEIMLDIKHAASVEKALQRFIKMELLDGENLYMCPRCKRKVPAHKQVLVHRAPNILTVQLKRFDYNQIFGGKVSKHVEYTEDLNLRPYMTSQGPPVKYRLYAVLLHSGYSCNSGHYYCYVKASNGMWYQMNDSSVRQANLKAVLSQQAYLLFYAKSPSSASPAATTAHQIMSSPRTPATLTFVRQNSNRTPAKPGIYFKQLSNSTSTITQFTSPPAPLRPSAEREKFSFCFPIKAKGQETDLDKKKNEGSKNKDEEGKEKGEKLEGNENSRIPVSGNHSSVIKSPVNTDDHTSPKDSETLDTAQTPLASNSVSSDTQPRLSPDKQSERESASEKSLPAKKEEQRRSPSPTRKPRPPPLFIPRAVVQGKHTPQPAARATTPWKVTPKTTTEPIFGPMSPPPPGVTQPQQSPQSAMSDTSSTSSVLGKTGEWTVSDKMNLTPGPRLPERQHAGWTVTDRPGTESVCEAGNEEDKNEESAQESDDKGTKKAKKKHAKGKKKRKKSKKKYSRLSESGSEGEEQKKKRNGLKTEKNPGEAKQECDMKEGSRKRHKRKRKNKDEEGRNEGKKKQRLVAYDESSSSSSDEQDDRNRKSTDTDSKCDSNKCRVPVICDGESRQEVARRATWDGSRDSSTVSQLVSNRGGLHGYGNSVTSWEGGKNSIDSYRSEPDRKRHRRDSLDEDYDRGKEKKVKQKSKESRERHCDSNPFQREHERRSKKGFRERFSRQESRSQPLQHHRGNFKSHSYEKYRKRT